MGTVSVLCNIQTSRTMLVALVSTLLAVASAQLNPDCCMPESARYTIHTENGTVHLLDGTVFRESTFLKGNFDYSNNRISLKGLNTIDDFSGNVTIQRYWVLSTPTKSLFISEEYNVCYVMPEPIWFPRFCIPGDAQHLGNSTYGPPGKGFVADNYRFSVNGTNYFAAVDEGCTPVSLVQSKNTGTITQMLTSAISNLSFILDQAAFTIPSWCNETL